MADKRKSDYWHCYRKVRTIVKGHISAIYQGEGSVETSQGLENRSVEPDHENVSVLPDPDCIEQPQSQLSVKETSLRVYNQSPSIFVNEDPLSSDDLREVEDIYSENPYISDTDSDGDDLIADKSLEHDLQSWATTHKVTHASLRDLLSILGKYHTSLPKDPRTLLRTANECKIVEVEGGSYYHFGLAASLLKAVDASSVHDIESVSVQFNIDGLPLFKSTNAQLWPILCRLIRPVETAPFVVGLYSGNKKPGNVHTYLQFFREELENLLTNGVKCPNSDRTVLVYVSCFICDTPARAFVKQTKGHSGYYGCDRCCQKGRWVEKVTFPAVDAELRTDLQFDELSNPEHHIGQSPLLGLPIGMVSQFPLDYMHLVCLGVMRRLLWLWMKGPLTCRQGAGFVRHVSSAIIDLARFMPKEFLRKGRELADLDRWKATEFRQFLLYLGPVILRRSLPLNYYRHFMLLSVAIYCLSSPLFCHVYCDYARQLLVLFVSQIGELYGDNQYVYNMHGLVHLADDVSRFGALDSFSAFVFESFLGRLKKLVRKPKYPLQQVVRRLSENCIGDFLSRTTSLSGKSSVKKQHFNGPIPREYAGYLQFAQLLSPSNVFLSVKEGNNCVIVQDKVCTIQNILSPAEDSEERLLVVDPFSDATQFYSEPLLSSDLRIFRVKQPSGDIHVVNVSEIVGKCILLPYRNGHVAIPLIHTLI